MIEILSTITTDSTQNQLLIPLVTVGIGLLIFPVQQIFLKFYLEPLQDLRKLIVRAAVLLASYQHTPDGEAEVEKFRDEIFPIVYELKANLNIASGYWVFRILRLLPSKKKLIKSVVDLHEMTNIVGNFVNGAASSGQEPIQRFGNYRKSILSSFKVTDANFPEG